MGSAVERDNEREKPLPALPEDPLALSAPLARAWAKTLCRHVNESGVSCAGYHAIWQDLRRLGLIPFAAPPAHAQFFLHAFSDAIRSGHRRVLVSGSADYSMPAVVLWAFAAAGATPEVTVVDICETPLRLCAWYADHIGARIETIASDISAYRPAQPYDVIVTHSFLGEFSPIQRERLVALWHDWLVPGGRVITINRIHTDGPRTMHRTAEQVEPFHARLRREATARIDELGITPAELAALADDYLAHLTFYPLHSRQELMSLFEENGFGIDLFAVDSDAAGSRWPSGVTVTGKFERAKLVAIRR
jgi:hypothetical protein